MAEIPRTKRQRCGWYDSVLKKRFTAGGILFYDEEGIYVVDEARGYSDFGGRYAYEDGSIWATIRRELYEETFGGCDLLVKDIEDMVGMVVTIDGDAGVGLYIRGRGYALNLAKNQKSSCIPLHEKSENNSYICLIVPVLAIGREVLDNAVDMCEERRKKFIEDNPMAPKGIYPCGIRKIMWEIGDAKLSYRLKTIVSMLTYVMFKN